MFSQEIPFLDKNGNILRDFVPVGVGKLVASMIIVKFVKTGLKERVKT